MAKMKKNEINYITNDLKDIAGKKVIVTGANSGIGFAICEILVKKHAHVIMACRNQDKALAAKNKILEENPDADIDILLYNQATVAGGYELAHVLILKHPDFHSLILNAGIIGPKKEELYGNRICNTFGVNFISELAILYGLREFLDKSEEEHRVIIQGSLVGRSTKYKKGQLYRTKYGKFKKYNISKCGCLNAFLDARDSNTNPNTFYGYCEPGIANTSIIRNFSSFIQKVGYWFLSFATHSNYSAALPACVLACNYIANGDAYVPKGFQNIKGLPKKIEINKKPDINMMYDGRRILGDINGARW